MSTMSIANAPHDRKLGLIGVSLTRARLHRDSGKALDHVRDEIETIIGDSRFLEDASFGWVTLAIRYGLENEEKPHYQRINSKYGDLPLAIEVDTNEILEASLEVLVQIYRRAGFC